MQYKNTKNIFYERNAVEYFYYSCCIMFKVCFLNAVIKVLSIYKYKECNNE